VYIHAYTYFLVSIANKKAHHQNNGPDFYDVSRN
jgi:hypothetical protein